MGIRNVILFVAVLAITATCDGSVLPDEAVVETAPGVADTAQAQTPTRFAAFNTYTVYTNPIASSELTDSMEDVDYSNNGFVLTAANIADAPLDQDKTTAIIVHDFGGSATTTLNPTVKNAFLSSTERDHDVIVVGWVTMGSYEASVELLPIYAQGLAEVINQLVDAEKVTLRNIHFVGFGLGAHFVGMTARLLDTTVIRKITALDPAADGWSHTSARLRSTDARYVEVIHTDITGRLAYGLSEAIGHGDFYPNGGTRHLGCSTNACYHERAWQLFAASLTHPGALNAHKCTDETELNRDRCSAGVLEVMGGAQMTKSQTGIFRVNTGRNYPFTL